MYIKHPDSYSFILLHHDLYDYVHTSISKNVGWAQSMSTALKFYKFLLFKNLDFLALSTRPKIPFPDFSHPNDHFTSTKPTRPNFWQFKIKKGDLQHETIFEEKWSSEHNSGLRGSRCGSSEHRKIFWSKIEFGPWVKGSYTIENDNVEFLGSVNFWGWGGWAERAWMEKGEKNWISSRFWA